MGALEIQIRAFKGFFCFLMLHYVIMALILTLISYHSVITYVFSVIVAVLYIVFFIVWYIRKTGDKNTFVVKGIHWQTWFRLFLLCISHYIIVTIIYGYPICNTKNHITKELLIFLLRPVIYSPIIEEILFRGLLQKRLSEKLPYWWSILITTILFILFHLKKTTKIFSLFMIGTSCLYGGIIYYKTDKLILCILFHSLYNILIGISQFSYKYIPMLQILSFMIAISIAVYAIRGLMKDSTLNLKCNVATSQITNKNENFK